MKLFLASSLDKTLELFKAKFEPAKNKVLFVANAADPFDEKWWVDADREQFAGHGFELKELDLRNVTAGQLRAEFESADILHVCGGSVFYLLSVLQKNNLVQVIKDAVTAGRIIYTGTSAGSIIPAQSVHIYTADPEEIKYAHLITDFSALGLVNFVIVPHCNNPEFIDANKAVIEQLPKDNSPLICISDDQAVWIEDGKFEILTK